MAGHSKWANIKHRKAAQDKVKGKIFSKLIKEITVAARMGDPDPAANPRLRLAVDKALDANMTKDTITRAIRKGAGLDEGGNQYEDVRYEGYGPSGVAIMVDCTTDNRNRTVGEVRHAFSKFGGNLGTDGSVAYLFNEVGVITFPSGTDEERLMEIALEAGAEDITPLSDGTFEIITSREQLAPVKQALIEAGLRPESSDIEQRAEVSAVVDSLDKASTLLKLLDFLDDLDDVQTVHSNAEIPDDMMAALE
jgi:YebC/PmpR family DNA-binding regulatory protein